MVLVEAAFKPYTLHDDGRVVDILVYSKNKTLNRLVCNFLLWGGLAIQRVNVSAEALVSSISILGNYMREKKRISFGL